MGSRLSSHNINKRDTYGDTALHEAVRKESWEQVSVLLQHGADVNKETRRNKTPLYHLAARRGAPGDILIRLISPHNINMQDENGYTALHWVVRQKRWKLVPVLLQHGADVNLENLRNQTPLYYGVHHVAPADIITQLISTHNINKREADGNTVLIEAVRWKRWELLPVLLQHGADVNLFGYWNRTPLHLAAYAGAPADITTQLISPHNINNRDEDGNTVLNEAVRQKRWEHVPVLLQHEADVNLENRWNQTPLHLALLYGAPADIITRLISPHNINIQDEDGNTALHGAVREERWELVPVLLQHGADPSMLDSPQSDQPLVHSLKALCIVTIRSHMPVKSDEAYEGLGLPGKLVDEVKLRPQAEDIVNRGRCE